MIVVQICLGSSCHLKGSMDLVEMLEKEIKEKNLEDEVVLTGGFCLGKCNREGVTVKVDDDEFVGVTVGGFREFFDKNILERVKAGE